MIPAERLTAEGVRRFGGTNIALDGLVRRLLSLFDMLRRWALAFGTLQACLVDFEYRLAQLDPQAEVPKTDQHLIRAELNTAKEPCQILNLEISLRQIERLLAVLYPASLGDFRVRAGDLRDKLRTLRETVDDELKSRRFLFVPGQKAILYEEDASFGPTVAQNFAKASFHIREAGSCLALGRATASVFHLMCVLEVALDSLAHYVGLPYSEKNWGTILDEIEKKIQLIDLGRITVPPNWDKTWASQVAVRFFHFKEAWRNHTAHARAKYTESEADGIFDHVRTFVQHLATRLQERP